ncbi:MAG: Cytochrome c, mono-and diheme variant [Lacunisphaera sp.]|nr:Cytochrome c, mono-and diheme variant [Lacunisphaera sp.]
MRYAYYTLAFVVVLLVSIMGFRGLKSTRPPIEVFPDMDHQAKYKPQMESKFFADGRADRPIPEHAVPYGRGQGVEVKRNDRGELVEGQFHDPAYLRADDFRYAGKSADGSFARGFPLEMTKAVIERGQGRYMIYCYPCHGALGDGNGITKSYGMLVTPSYHDDRIRNMPEGEIFNTITNGKNTMMPYADKLSADDRWAVIAYVRVLQRARHGTIDDVPADQRGGLK